MIYNMKQRITYLLPDGSNVDPSAIKIQDESIDFVLADRAVEEWRLTLELDELPDEVGRTNNLMVQY